MVLKRNIRDSLVVAHRDTGWRFWLAVVILLSALGTNIVIIAYLFFYSKYVFSGLLIFFLLLPGWFLCWVLKLHSHKRSIWLNMIGLGMLRDMILLHNQASGFFWPRLLFECSFHNAPSSVILILFIWLECEEDNGWLFKGRTRYLLFTSIALSTLAVGFSVAENTRVSWKTDSMPISIWIMVLGLFTLDILTRAGVFFFALCLSFWAGIIVVSALLIMEFFFFWWICKCPKLSAFTLLFSHYCARYCGKRSEIEFGSRIFVNSLVSILASVASAKGIFLFLLVYLICICINLCIYVILRGHMHSQWTFEYAKVENEKGSADERLSDHDEQNIEEIELETTEAKNMEILNVPTFASTQMEPDDLLSDQVLDQEIVEESRQPKFNNQNIFRLQNTQLEFSTLKSRKRRVSEGERFSHLCVKTNPRDKLATLNSITSRSLTNNYFLEHTGNKILLWKDKPRFSLNDSSDADSASLEPYDFECNWNDQSGKQINSTRTSTHSSVTTETLGQISGCRFSPAKPNGNVTLNLKRKSLTRNTLMSFDRSRQWDKSVVHEKTFRSTTLSTVWTHKLDLLNEQTVEVCSAVSNYDDMLSSQNHLSVANNEESIFQRSSVVSYITSIFSDLGEMTIRHEYGGDGNAPKVTIWTRAKAVLVAMEEYRDSFKRLNFIKRTVCEVHICDICLAEIFQGEFAYWEPNVVSCLTLLGGISVCEWCFTTNVQGCEVETHTCQVCQDTFTVRVELIQEECSRMRFCSKCNKSRPPCFLYTAEQAESWLTLENGTEARGWVKDVPRLDDDGLSTLVTIYFTEVEAMWCSEGVMVAGTHRETRRNQTSKSLEVRNELADRAEDNHTNFSFDEAFIFQTEMRERTSATVDTEKPDYVTSPSVIFINENSDSIYFDYNCESSPSIVIQNYYK